MRPFQLLLALSILAPSLALPSPVAAQDSPPPPDTQFSYADLADLALSAPIVARAEIDRANRLDPERAPGIAPGHVRFYVEAELSSLIRSAGTVPREVRYLVDLPLGADGRSPRIRGNDVLIMASPVRSRPGELQLASPSAQIGWTPERERLVRAMLTEATAANAPGLVTGVASAFSVPGALPGESETQIFLSTSDGRPVSISVLRRPNQQPRWAVSLSEIVESASPPPARNTLLWYRLACFLPDELPRTTFDSMDPSQISIARQDYQMVIRDLGRCDRYRS